jgi:hypothetical protein
LAGLQQSYRAYRLEWDAVPAADPALFVENGNAYFSWNGATGVESWEIFEGTTATNIEYTHTVKKAGFETQASICTTTKFVKVVAVHRHGKRASTVVPVS